MNSNDAITETDLHAYIDGHLDETDRVRVEAWLAEHPEDRSRIEAWQAQAQMLRSTFSAFETTKEEDQALLTPAPRRWMPFFARNAAACLIFAAGAIAGQFVPLMRVAPDRRARSATRTTIGLPPRSARGLFGRRVEARRAGMMTMGFTV